METFGDNPINFKNTTICEICDEKCCNITHINPLNNIKNTSKFINNTSKKMSYCNTSAFHPLINKYTDDNGVLVVNGDNDVIKNINNLICKFCTFNCYKLGDWKRHINTKKHKKLSATNKKDVYSCDICQKEYNSRNGMWKHKQKCSNPNIRENITTELVLELIKNNNEFKHIIMEQNNTINNLVKNGITNQNIITNNITNNSHNKTFNLQIFLNETCKDAMNIMDFVNSIKLQLSDFERIGEVGYTQGISDIITTNLKALDVTQRPVHCTDQKREIIYVKDENQWKKEDNNNPKIRKMIKHVENKNIQILPKFREKYPNYANPSSCDSDKYNKTIIEAMGGIGDAEEKENKIIRNITKYVTIDKE